MKLIKLSAHLEIELEEEVLKELGGEAKARTTLVGIFCEEGARAVIRHLEANGIGASLGPDSPDAEA